MPLTPLRRAVWIACAMLVPSPALAQDSGPVGAAPFLDLTFQTPQQKQPPRQGWFWDNRPRFRSGRFELDVHARVQADYRASDAPLGDDESAFTVTRRRIGVEGSFDGWFDFEIERELRSDDPWRDVFVNYSQFEFLQVQAGKFKIPFSLDETTSVVNLDFVYRSMLGSSLAPGRSRGLMLHGRAVDRIIRYEYGWFEDDGDNAAPGDGDDERARGGRTRAGRIGVAPLRRFNGPGSDLLVSVNWTESDLDGEGPSTIRGRTAFERRFFSSDYPITGKRQRRGIDVRVRPGPASVRAEFVRMTDERLGLSVEDTDLPPIRATAWYVSGSYVLTGEEKGDGVTPDKPFLQGGIGAIEVALRVEDLKFDSGSDAEGPPSTSPRSPVIIGNAARTVTIGGNWYVNRWIKVQFNLIRERIQDPEQGPLPSQPSFWSRVFRVQFVL